MANSKAKWQRLPDKYKWLVRVAMLLLAVGNGWEWYGHMTSHNPIVAIIDALFVVLCLWFLYQSF